MGSGTDAPLPLVRPTDEGFEYFPRPERSIAVAENAAESARTACVGRIKPCRLIRLEQHVDPRGTLSVVESGMTTDFAIQRVYYMYGQPESSPPRGVHGHRTLEQVVIAAHGGFSVRLDDGFQRAAYRLEEPGVGLYIGPMVWRVLQDFTPGSVALVLASRHYEEADYYRDYDTFLRDARSLP